MLFLPQFLASNFANNSYLIYRGSSKILNILGLPNTHFLPTLIWIKFKWVWIQLHAHAHFLFFLDQAHFYESGKIVRMHKFFP